MGHLAIIWKLTLNKTQCVTHIPCDIPRIVCRQFKYKTIYPVSTYLPCPHNQYGTIGPTRLLNLKSGWATPAHLPDSGAETTEPLSFDHFSAILWKAVCPSARWHHRASGRPWRRRTQWQTERRGTISELFRQLFPVIMHSWWRHQMETISALLALCAGNSPVPVNCPHKGQWRGALMFTLICAQINGWVNNREAGDVRRYRAHYDVIVMLIVLVLDKSCGHNGDFSFAQQAWNRGQCEVISPKTSWYGAILHISTQY